MVRFKTIKFKHYRKARELMTREETGEDVEVEYLIYAISMVAEWDFVDDETGKALPLEGKSIGEMSMDQIKEVSSLFNQQFGDMSQVKKTNSGPSPSTSTPSKPVENQQPTPLSGFTPSSLPED